MISTPAGTQIPLSQVADVQVTEGPNQIQREDAQRRIVVGFNVRGRDVQSMVKELQQKVDTRLKLPPGYHVTYGGAFENLEAAKSRLSVAVPVALFLILLMLYFAFGSFKHGLLIYSAIPLSAIGGIVALALRGMPFSISAGIGFIALFGVAVLNGIVLISEFNRLRKEGMEDLAQVVIEGTNARLRPVLMTAAVASLGFLPMALSSGAGAEVQRPLATVVIGGLVIATLLTLFVLPVLYISFEKATFFKKWFKPKVALLFILIAGTGISTKAQQPITLQAAIDTAFKNNLEVKGQTLNAAYLQKLIGTSTVIPKTAATVEYGNINSYYNDTRFGIGQTINFPTVYKRQKSLLNEEWKGGQLNIDVKKLEIRRRVTEVFYELLYLGEKRKILLQSDSLYVEFLRRATLRFEKGETNILEKTTAQMQRGQIALQLQQLVQDSVVLQNNFKTLLQSETAFIPQATDFKIPLIAFGDTSLLANHPQLRYLQQQRNIASAQTGVEKSKLTPDLSLSYFNQSFKGYQNIGGTDKYFSGSKRFSSVQAGVAIPIFNSAQRTRINAARINEEIAQNNYLIGQQALNSQYRQTFATYQKYLQTMAYYETSALPNANIIASTANKQFFGGDINYLDWVLLMNQAITIRSEYIEALRSFNQTTIQLNNFSNQ